MSVYKIVHRTLNESWLPKMYPNLAHLLSAEIAEKNSDKIIFSFQFCSSLKWERSKNGLLLISSIIDKMQTFMQTKRRRNRVVWNFKEFKLVKILTLKTHHLNIRFPLSAFKHSIFIEFICQKDIIRRLVFIWWALALLLLTRKRPYSTFTIESTIGRVGSLVVKGRLQRQLLLVRYPADDE